MMCKWLRNNQAVIARPQRGRSNLLRTNWYRGIASSRVAALAVLAMTMLACDRTKTTWEYMPDMSNSPAVKAYEPDARSPGNRTPVAGTVPRGYEPYLFPTDPEAAGTHLRNPLPRTAAILAKGQKTFNTHCAVCHGSRGLGDGSIVPKFPKPPSLIAAKVTDWSDGRIFHVITRGQNLMPAYASQIDPEERWAAVHYLRVLQRAGHPQPEDVQRVLESVQ